MNQSTATNRRESVTIEHGALGMHLEGNTAVFATTTGLFAVVNMERNRNGALRLIRLFSNEITARRYNYAINGDSLGF